MSSVNAQPSAPATGSLTETAYETIKRRIRTCELLPGTRFTEKQLVQTLGYGKTPVGEALARLAAENLVRVIPRSGYEVSPLTLRDFEEVTELSRIVWPAMMVLACERSSEAMREKLLASSGSTWLEGARSLLQEAAYATGNSRLAETSMRLYDEMERFVILATRSRLSSPPQWNQPPEWLQERQKQIFGAFIRRDTTELAKQVALLVDETYHNTLALLQTLPSILDTPLI